jgi:type II secretory pathway component GspD/PulD (secretin)
MKKIVASLLLVAPCFVGAQSIPTDNPKVTVVARGHDVRQVLSDIFGDAKKSCVIQRNLQCNLYLSLENTPFDQALDIICKQANLTYEVDGGVYFIHTVVKPTVAPTHVFPVHVAPAVVIPKVLVPHKLSSTVLAKRLTTRFHKAALKAVLDEFGTQTGITIELDPQVPSYKMDAFLINTSLKYALDEVTHAANLCYKFTDHYTILVSEQESKVALIP